MGLKNLVGDLRGYARCPITNESLYGGYATVWYKHGTGLLVAERATHLPADELAEAVYRFVVQDGRAQPSETSPEQIKSMNRLSELRAKRSGYLSRGGLDVEIESIDIR